MSGIADSLRKSLQKEKALSACWYASDAYATILVAQGMFGMPVTINWEHVQASLDRAEQLILEWRVN